MDCTNANDRKPAAPNGGGNDQGLDAASGAKIGKSHAPTDDFCNKICLGSVYICPTGERLAHYFTNEENGLLLVGGAVGAP